MLKKNVWLLASALMVQVAAAQDIEVSEAWARPTLEGMSQGGAFMKLHNRSSQDDVLVGASVRKKLAGRTELHTHINDNGVMRMREVKEGIPLPAGQTQELKPGGYHVMYFDLKRPLKAGDTFPMTLKFQHGKSRTVTVKVKEMKATGSGPSLYRYGQPQPPQGGHAH